MEVMKIHIPTPLRTYTDKNPTVSVVGATVAEGLDALVTAHPAMRQHLFTPDGKLRSFVNLYLNDEDVRYLPAKEATSLSANDELTIIPSIAGGSPCTACCCR
jgi:sulfur-carrier protein